MKKLVLAILIASGIFSAAKVKAQSFNVVADTVWATVYSVASVSDNITNITANDVALWWHVTASSFPTDWIAPIAFGICDNSDCKSNTGYSLWNNTTSMGDTYLSVYKPNATHDSMAGFSLSLDFTSVTTMGSHWIKVNLKDTSTLFNRNIVFVLNKKPTGIITPGISTNDMVVYPNPVHETATISFNLANSSNVQVKVIDLLGRIVYAVPNQEMGAGMQSINISTGLLPSGVYSVLLQTADQVFSQKLRVE